MKKSSKIFSFCCQFRLWAGSTQTCSFNLMRETSCYCRSRNHSIFGTRLRTFPFPWTTRRALAVNATSAKKNTTTIGATSEEKRGKAAKRQEQTERNNELILDSNNTWKATIGLEIHAQIAAESKLFSGSGTSYGDLTNSNVSFFDTALPGTLPVLNQRCVEAGVLTALVFNCEINTVSKFDRKHYFYADLPTGYQITQQRQPLAKNGFVEYWVYDQKHRTNPYKKRTKIYQIQLEQDSGKSIQDMANQRTLVDLNRAGVGLMEIVTEPNLSDGFEAASLVKEISSRLKAVKTCNGEMDKGHLRVDANISISKSGELGIRTEVKNLNSFKFVRQAVEYEISRQIKLKESGQEVTNETRTFDYVSRRTVSMRDKEVLQDYRYMPEPNLPPLRLCEYGDVIEKHRVNIQDLREKIPPLPSVIREYWIHTLNVPPGDALFILNDDVIKKYFEDCLNLISRDAVPLMTYWVMYVLREILKLEYELTLDSSPVSPNMFCRLVLLLHEEKITEGAARKVLRTLITSEANSPEDVINSMNMWRIRNRKELLDICSCLTESEMKMVQDIKQGRKASKKQKALVRSISVRCNNRIATRDIEETLSSHVLKSE